MAADASEPSQNAIYKHADPLGASHVLWWPFSKGPEPGAQSTLILFIPGNPGHLAFYTPFLSTIYDKTAASSSSRLAILAHSYLGQTPGLADDNVFSHPERVCLTAQVQAVIEVLDSLKSAYGDNTRIVMIGHSVGTWITLQALKARHDHIAEVFLLFPTIQHILQTPYGRRWSWLFRGPFPRILSTLSTTSRIWPTKMVSLILRDWPPAQLQVLLRWLRSPPSVFAVLTMAHDEMQTIRELDIALMDENRHRICLYFGDQDMWVGEQKDAILRLFNPDPGSMRVFHGPSDIPHAFCINHGELVASQCLEWLKSGGFI
ncbi:hypothetical protein GLOTRDRAFT_135140 [Gloeophyllum trabeum ATCC 11539]|uniref:Alpha/beta-hydrolase n=1 Tax=Gloeophyllum trabeum (strain ATCC 11539 / FP-39264 / Madison 617) TaxID=670483 RepID=S7QM02_GLOTA|nr:uncharacterized protein GLOTRDRAFT_135140 [Gloeophyllum trabeum ATCC 11539]EPQ60467.1 hypothetical protein GLOTRDRAFT_135140 [Gloeophyllum trabeum ATCC 11539]